MSRCETVPLSHPKYGAVDDVRGMGIPIKFSSASVSIDGAAPMPGEHNNFVYGEILGYSAEKISDMKVHNVI